MLDYIKNGTGGAVTKGQAVYISSADGTNVIVSLADADTEATSSKTLGLLYQDLAVNGLGYIVTDGLLSNIDTSAAGAAGDSVWLSSTAGGIVFGAPPAKPAHSVYLGVVARKHAVNGEILVKVQNGYELNELHDVNAGSPSDNNVLAWNSATSMWTNQTVAEIGAAATSHTHAPADITGTAVITTDSRLSNARTPTAHASSHASGGSDAITLGQSQVVGLESSLAARPEPGSAGIPYRMAANSIPSFTGNASVTFPSGRFSVTPIVTATMASSTTVTSATVGSVTSSGFTIYAWAGGSAATTGRTAQYQAIQMTSGAAGG